MGDPISLACGLLTLATFAFQSSVTLCDTIKSFNTHLRRVQDLMEELQALSDVLGPLTEIVNTNSDTDLSALKLPLLRCGNACKDFEKELLKCSSRSSGNRTSFRDWARIRYMGDDIDGRKSSVTAESLKAYQGLIESAKEELEVHLEVIDGKLDAILGKDRAMPDVDNSELRVIQEERLSAEKCLQICSQLSQHISQIQVVHESDHSTPGLASPDSFPERVTNESLQDCKRNLSLTAEKLEKHMRDLTDRLLAKSKREMTSEEYLDLQRLRDEWDTARQCMDICSKADARLRENASTIENYATGDSVQFMVSTDGKTIHGKNRGLGWRNRQVGGHLSDVSVQQLSRDMTSMNIRHVESEVQTCATNTPSVPDSAERDEPPHEFKDRYGRGFKLAPDSSSAIYNRA
ncbi:uncharacterized protein P174DRAFT_515133 [Aspergillus novofumigatus IBT 16806]|uniref:Azaphilone pigments biosynthesis cluster protein L N-terminal domain-containing protein n=1 Tax=Aspergillus novofumigatus (strain IBT 16806) TaxID=1392255 RepID=A0A2I1C0X3_ASPN1|nr:uncharacterized protein P174DRAFT_515133 [Aspergillus novofumigatus IBT 16806]PKX91231.1 hypothetical protein P174DRAFT_515133 [Aspergillus novofumigatus IBT 16806]